MNLLKICLVAVLVCSFATAKPGVNDSSTDDTNPLVMKGGYQANFLQRGFRSCMGWVGYGVGKAIAPVKTVCSMVGGKVAAGVGVVGSIGAIWAMGKYLPSWVSYGLLATVGTTLTATALTVKGLYMDPLDYVESLHSGKYTTWALRLVTKTVGVVMGFEADKEIMLLAGGVAKCQRKLELKLTLQVDGTMGSGKLKGKNLQKIKDDLKLVQKQIKEEVCPELMKTLKRSKNNSSFIMALFKIIASLMPQIKVEQVTEYSEEVISWLTPAVLESAFMQLCILGMQKKLKENKKLDPQTVQAQLKTLQTIQITAAVPFGGLVAKFMQSQNRKKSEAQRENMSKNRSNTAPVQLSTEGTKVEEKKAEDLTDRAQSEFGESTSSMVMMVMLGLCLVLMGGIYFIIKGLDNPGDSEYPDKLGSSDLNKAELMV